MRHLVFLAALACAGAGLADTPAAIEPDDDKPIPRSIFLVDDKGDATHLETGWICPAVFGDYRRANLHNYNAYGLDVPCGYASTDSTITLYLTKNSGGDLKGEFESAKDALVHRATDAAPLADADQTTFPSDRDWLHAIYSSHNGAMRDGVWYAWYGDWEFEIRATYPAQSTAAMFAMLAQMTQAARATGDHLARCAKSATPLRDGALVTDKDRLMQLSVLGSIMSMAQLASDPKADPASHKVATLAPAEWCAEAAVPNVEAPVLMLHALDANGAGLPLDRAMLMTYEDAPVLESAADPEIALVLSEMHKNGPPLYVVSRKNGDTFIVHRFYDGRPDGAALAQIFADLQAGKARVYMSFDPKTKNVNIVMPPKG